MILLKVKTKLYKGLKIKGKASNVLFKGAVRCMNRWKENLDSGTGADGSHGRPYRDRGQTVNDVTMSPQTPGSSEYAIGGDVIQLAVAEFGRVATPGRPPPFDVIAQWVKRKGIAAPGDDGFYPIVEAIRWKIAAEGLKGFAPGRRASEDTEREMEKELNTLLDDVEQE